MDFKRHIELLSVLWDAAALPEKVLERLDKDTPSSSELFEMEVEYEITSFSEGRPAVMHLRNGDPGYPAEGPEFEVDMPPEIVGALGIKILVEHLKAEEINLDQLRACHDAIEAVEQKWQDENLDHEVWETIGAVRAAREEAAAEAAEERNRDYE